MGHRISVVSNHSLNRLQVSLKEGGGRMLKGWLDEVETEVIGYLQDHQSASFRDLASGLRISEALALSYIGILARQGKVTISGLGIRGHAAQPSSDDRDLKAAAL